VLLIRRSLVRVQVEEPPNIKALANRFGLPCIRNVT